MPVIKISTPWHHIDFSNRISSELKKKYIFYFDEPVDEVDYWIVWGGLKKNEEQVICSPENIIYLTDEVFIGRYFYQNFLNQFSSIITCRKDLKHKSVIFNHELNTWMVNRDYDWIEKETLFEKKKMMSVVCSDQTWLEGHKNRYAFVNKLQGHFKDRIDFFGRGFKPIDDKFDALADYKYSIAIENSSIPGYFTEKISDCYLTHTMPIYYGCPNIHDYFDADSMLVIDINNWNDAIVKIENLLHEDSYSKKLESIKNEKTKYLKQYHIFDKLIFLLENQFEVQTVKKKIVIKSEKTFQRGFALNNLFSKFQHFLRIALRNRFEFKFPQNDLYSNYNK